MKESVLVEQFDDDFVANYFLITCIILFLVTLFYLALL